MLVVAVEFCLMLALGYIQAMPEKDESGEYKLRFSDDVVRAFAALAAIVALFKAGENLESIINDLMVTSQLVAIVVVLAGMVILASAVYLAAFYVAKIGNTLFPDD